ncbi:MAG: circadian clock protein KaiC, partial [Solirubrobacterales bacterium]|nr:circadian clock protein KaiC [Solirubrobacterales bacterium]
MAPGGLKPLPKTPTGVHGLDEVTEGGLPRGRPTLVCGPAGCGKTLLGIEFLVRGITEHGENGVFLAFEETREDLIANVASLGFDLAQLEADGKLALDHVSIEPSEIEQSGTWDLDGLFIRLGASIDMVGADRVVIDTIENLFGAFSDTATLRAELRRLFRWLKDRGITAIITGERGDGSLTRHGIEEYVSDCVIVLDHRVSEETSTRRLRVLKYRGSLHGTNEYPFLITKTGVSVVPITSLGLEHDASGETLSMGVARLDEMLGGQGVLRGSSILVSGTAGTGKSTVAAQYCDAACRRGERALYFAFEESEAQIVRNMASVGMDLGQWVQQGLLRFKCVRPSLLGLEAHLSSMQDLVTEYGPSVVVVDPISDLLTAGASRDVSAMLTRQVDFLKVRGVTALFTSLDQDLQLEEANQQIAALIDVWLLVTTKEHNGERNRSLSVLKARGMAHSNQIREFLLTERGIEVADVHGLGEVLTGSA